MWMSYHKQTRGIWHAQVIWAIYNAYYIYILINSYGPLNIFSVISDTFHIYLYLYIYLFMKGLKGIFKGFFLISI